MDGIHDLGGMDGFGPIEREVDEPIFHAHWEGRVFAIAEILGECEVIPNIDAFRHAVERIDPVAYLTAGYYGRWLAGIEGLLDERGALCRDELQNSVRERDPSVRAVRIMALNPPWDDTNDDALREPGARRSIPVGPRFRLGQHVRTIDVSSPGHTRLPRYARGKRGTVHKHHGGWVYPDSNAHGTGEQPQHLYTIAFTGNELWGKGGEPNVTVHLDLFQPYLQEV